jgi:MtN3 and saliva related transmembrane protein
MDVTFLIGSLAATASTISFVPQAWKIIRERSTKGLSVFTYSFTVAGFVLWIAYGILLQQWPLIVPNVICFALSLFIFIMICLPDHKTEKVAQTVDPLE